MNPQLVPVWADAEEVVDGFTTVEGVINTGLYFNRKGLGRALEYKDKLTLFGSISLTASESFTQKNLNRSHIENLAAMKRHAIAHFDHKISVNNIGVMTAFGCNYQGDITPTCVVYILKDGMRIAEEIGVKITDFSLADTMGWASPHKIESVLGEVRNEWPEMQISLHLHDTRGLAVANAYAALKMEFADSILQLLA